jgi:hypothetical protein
MNPTQEVFPGGGELLLESDADSAPLAAAASDQPSSHGSEAAAPASPRWATTWPSVEPKLFPTCRATTTTLRYCSHTYIKQASKWMEPSTCTNCVERTKERPDSNALNQVCKTAQNYENMITWTHDIVILLPSRLTGDTSNWLQAHCQDKSTTSNHVQSKQTRNKRKISLPVYSKSAWLLVCNL